MESYVSHVQIDRSPRWGPKSYPPGTIIWGPYDAPSMPLPATLLFEPHVAYQSVVPSPKPSPSWEAVKRSGAIRMTPYRAEKLTQFNSLASREDMAVTFRRTSDFNVTVNPPKCAGIEFFEQSVRWREQGDFAYWSALMDVQELNDHTLVDLKSEIASTQTSAIASFRGGYDALTEAAEIRQGLDFFKESSVSLYGFFRGFFGSHGDTVRQAIQDKRGVTARDLLKSTDRKVRAAGSAWLAYRYAVMPLIYSFQDVSQLIRNRDIEYQSYRDRDTVEIRRPSTSGLSNGLYNVTSGSLTVSSVVKARYSNAFLRDYVSNQVQWNPLATAWELVPLSFVFDWFVNVGDFIVATTSSDLSVEAAGCTSIKTHVTVETVLRNAVSKEFKRSWPVLQYCQPAVVDRVVGFQTNTTETCRTTVVERYVRSPFDLDAASLVFNPSINWKRSVDAAALSYSPLKKLLRKFRK